MSRATLPEGRRKDAGVIGAGLRGRGFSPFHPPIHLFANFQVPRLTPVDPRAKSLPALRPVSAVDEKSGSKRHVIGPGSSR